MSSRLRCPRGHQWEASPRPGSAAACPTCGLSPTNDVDATVHQAGPLLSLPPLSSQEPPPVVPDYEVLGELGRGGMGVVYKARRQSTNQVVALKVIRKDRLQHEEAVRRFRREAQAAARLSHPNIVHVVDSDHSGDVHYLVMEFVPGVTLEKLVQQQGPQPIDRAVDFIRQAALGLQHAFEQALVHRDIKPSNLIVSPPPPAPNRAAAASRYDYVVKILDMGVARVLTLGGGESLSTLTQGGAVIGTADYVAPEQLEDPHRADVRADLYSLGCTLYFLLTGQVPFPGGTLVSKLDKQRWEAPASVHQTRPDVPPGLLVIVQKLMAKNPRDRFKTPADLVAALEDLPRQTRGAVQSLPARARLEGHAQAVWSIALLEDGVRFLSAGKDKSLRLGNLQPPSLEKKLSTFSQEIRAVTLLPGTERCALAAGATVRLFDLKEEKEYGRLAGHTGAIKCLAAYPDGRRLFSGSADRSVRVWDLVAGREVQRLTGHTGEVTGLALVGPEGPLLSASRDQTLRLWELRSALESQRIFTGSPILGLAVDARGRLALTAHYDTLVRLWDLQTGRELRRFLGHKNTVSAVCFLPDERRFLSAGQDASVRLWDLETGAELACLEGPRGGVHALTVAAQGKMVLAAGADPTIHLWDVPPLPTAKKNSDAVAYSI